MVGVVVVVEVVVEVEVEVEVEVGVEVGVVVVVEVEVGVEVGVVVVVVVGVNNNTGKIMRIKTISATGLKLGDFSHEIGPVTIFIGRNFSGKTARLEAVRLALLGYVPEQGKTFAATSGLARAGELSVALDMSDGQRVARTWRTERGTFKAGPYQPLDGVPPVLMDSNEYFGLGAKDQIRYVFGLAQIGTEAGAVVKTVVANLKNMRVENRAAEHETMIEALVHDAERRSTGLDRSSSSQDYIQNLTADFRDLLRIAKQNSARMASTVQGLTQLKAADTEETIRSVETELSTLRLAQTRLDGDVRLKRAEMSRLGAQAQERANLLKVLERIPDMSNQIATLEVEEAERNECCDGYESRLVAAGLARSTASNALGEATRELDRLRRELADRKKKFDADMAADKCPHCGSRTKSWRENIEADYVAFRLTNKTESDAESERGEQAKREFVAAEQSFQVALKADADNSTNQRRLAELARTLKTIRDGQTEAVNLRARIEAMGSATEAEQIEVFRTAAVAAGDEYLQVTARITELSGRQAAFQRAQQDTARNAQALLQHQAIGAEQAVLVEAVKMLEALQGEMVRQAFGPLLQRANRITDGILKSPIEYRDGELGRFEGPTWISHRTFSGTEKALTYAALAAALAHESPIKLVMIDELGRLDRQAKRLLVDRMVELTRNGEIDQFLGIDISPADYAGLSVQIVEVA